MPRRRVGLDQVAQRRSDFAGCSARPTPNSSRVFVTAANCTTSERPAVCSPAIQTRLAPIAALPWTRKARRARRTQGASSAFGASADPPVRRVEPFAPKQPTTLVALGRQVDCPDAVQPNRLRPSADFETGGRRRCRRPRPCGWVDRHAKTSATCVASRRYQRTVVRQNRIVAFWPLIQLGNARQDTACWRR